MAAIHEAWLFQNDSALVKFDNACCLQLSSCGAVFRAYSPTGNVKNSSVLCSKANETHCSQFATSMWKDMIKQAVDFRNKFASYPYLCHNLAKKTTNIKQCKVLSSTTKCTWSGKDFAENTNHDDGSISITSKENNAVVTISACKQTYIVNFLCQIQTKKQNGSEQLPTYSWVKQIHSSNSCYPNWFYYPMSMLNGGMMTDKDVELDLPQSLPQQCEKPHLHRWKSHWNAEKFGSSEFLDRELIKVFYSENVFYRFYYEKHLVAEILLPDGSVLRSTGPTHLYFKHWIYDLGTRSVKEYAYSANAPPLNDRTSSIAKILSTVSRYLKYLSVCWKTQSSAVPCCWKNDNDPLLVDAESELEFSTYIRDLGFFKRYTDGRIRIVFCDGAVMDFYYPDKDNHETRTAAEAEYYRRSSGKEGTTLLGETPFSLILPNGILCKSYFNSFAELHKRYVQTALDFIKSKQNHAKTEQLRLDDKNSSLVYEELEKLKRFTASDCKDEEHRAAPSTDLYKQRMNELQIGVNEVSSPPSEEQLETPSLSEVWNMQEYLSDTRKAVDEMEFVLQNCKKQLDMTKGTA